MSTQQTEHRHPLVDGMAVLYRNLLALRRNPVLLAANLAGPIGLVLVFGYVFGGSLRDALPGSSYREQIIPAAFVLVAGTGLVVAAGAAAHDVQNGVTERFRAMPMARFAVPFGASLSQLLLSVMSIAVMAVVGLLVGWQAHDGIGRTLAGFAVLTLFGYALTWMGIFLGLAIRDEEVVQQLAPVILAFVMVSNAFVPTSSMPAWLGTFAQWSPFSAAITALRDLFGNAAAPTGPWPLAHPVIATVAWSIGLLVVFAPLAARRYTRKD